MLQNLQRKVADNVLSEPKKINISSLTDSLSGICQSRFYAVSAYPHADGAKGKFEAISIIRAELFHAKLCLNPLEALKICLRLENHFLLLAPRKTQQLYDGYCKKIHSHMDLCRQLLGRRKQQ